MKLLYVEDFAYGRDCVRAIARELQHGVGGVVHLHDKLTEAAVEEFVQDDYDGVVSHLLHQSIRNTIDPDNRGGEYYSAYGYSLELLVRMRRHKDVPVVVFSGLDRTAYLPCREAYDVLVRKEEGVPRLCETMAVLFDRYQRLPKNPGDSPVIVDGQRVSVTTTVRNCTLTAIDRDIAGLASQIMHQKLTNTEVSVSGLPDEPCVTLSSLENHAAWADALMAPFKNCLLGLNVTIGADNGEDGETATMLARIAKYVNTRFPWEDGYDQTL